MGIEGGVGHDCLQVCDRLRSQSDLPMARHGLLGLCAQGLEVTVEVEGNRLGELVKIR
jgi:hypothetical protein